jgi:hypothetical protein
VTGDDEKGLGMRKITTVHPNTEIINGYSFYGREQDTHFTGISFTVKD